MGRGFRWSGLPQVDRDDDKADLGDSNYDEFSGYSGPVDTVAENDSVSEGFCTDHPK